MRGGAAINILLLRRQSPLATNGTFCAKPPAQKTMTVPFDSRLSVPSGVLVSEVGLESVFLNLRSESYFGLDEVGTRMWKLLTESDTVQQAFDQLLIEFNIDEAQLRLDLDELIQKLIANGLVEMSTPAS